MMYGGADSAHHLSAPPMQATSTLASLPPLGPHPPPMPPTGGLINVANAHLPPPHHQYNPAAAALATTGGNYFIVNIDGPINFNATHSLQDDGSDLPFTDINTMRFFYNLGIEVSQLSYYIVR